tara:strand:+ start:572 stop:733 length:162 start_codon:yes stop_codon:yes gene_type:complete
VLVHLVQLLDQPLLEQVAEVVGRINLALLEQVELEVEQQVDPLIVLALMPRLT